LIDFTAAEVNAWSVEEFLSNAGVMIDGGITRAAIILLGKPVSVFKLRPAVVRVTSTKSMEQKRRLLRHILEEMKNEDIIKVNGRTWFENGYKS